MVYFIGAGPGAVDLITVRGCELLKKADVVIYAGSLVNPELLSYTKTGCKIYNSASMTLEEVVEVIVKFDAQDKIVVRLHTGDPSIYGAIREQMDLLDKNNIEYCVVPGVSSFCGAASVLNAEYTLPDISQTVVLSRMEGRTPVPPDEDIVKLASHKASMVLFLTSSMIEPLSKKLVEGGYKAETPAAIVYKATWPDQKIIRTTVENLHKSAMENNISKTALILVGDFLSCEYGRSKLYDSSFTHEFRKAKQE
ncbi:precorrin-4 C(11)-methyltransferase [Acetivibrio cellulolyticus]|uniref:precorrin-4 C(11)-methyltransferase n=1 Tax=Acetivibrio cellulolyticus TaxID=35830 RepID=UPI0001E2CC08|nr:precorrin-4 C(11)-methyltransferase [Acetivibrio cellulolyticus]